MNVPRRSGARPTAPLLRLVVGRLCYAAAAHATGIWGPVRLERALAFGPQHRLRKAHPQHEASGLCAPTNCCKHWLTGHVPCDQTLRLISERLPHVATSMRSWRDGAVAQGLYHEFPLALAKVPDPPEPYGGVGVAVTVTGCLDDCALVTETLLAVLKSRAAGPNTLGLALWARSLYPVLPPAHVAPLKSEALRVLDETAAVCPEVSFAYPNLFQLCSR